MSSLFGKTIAFLALVVATVALGYTAWEIRELKASLARTAQGNESNMTEMMISLAHAEGQLARVRETVELLGASGLSENSDGTALEGKLTAVLSAAQREVLQQELKKWVQQLRTERDQSLAAVRESLETELTRIAAQRDQRLGDLSALLEKGQGSLAKQLEDLAEPSGAARDQGKALANLEKRVAAVAETVEKREQTLAGRNERDDKRWEELFLALQESRETTLRRYAELAARPGTQDDGTPKPANQGRTEQPRPTGQTPESVLTDQGRLARLCEEDPEFPLCRNR